MESISKIRWASGGNGGASRLVRSAHLGCAGFQRDLFAVFDYIGCHITDYKSRHTDRYADSGYNIKP